jgi:glycosyltransferase involved in cell wall biosynthesis
VGDTPQTTIVVPCYNEETRLPIARFKEFVAGHPGVQFLFVNDGSTDNTSAVLSGLVDSQPTRFTQLELSVNCGKAEAVRTGMQQALAGDSRYAGYWDADLATPLTEIPRFVEALETNRGCDICFGSRVRLLGRAIERKRYRHYLGRLFATVASYVLDLPVYDTQCGAKLFRVSPETRALFAEPFRVNWTFDVEIVARVQALRASQGQPAGSTSIYELPLNEWRDVAGSKVGARDFLKAMFEMWLIHRHYRRA